MTLRELSWMYGARRRESWSQLANLMALLANCHRDPKRRRRPFSVVDFLPQDLRAGVRPTSGLPLTAHNLRLLKPLFEKKA